MRVLLLSPHPFFETRGSPIAERALLRALAGEGHDLHVLTYAQGEDPAIQGCTIHRIPRLPGLGHIRPGFSWKKVVSDVLMLGACWRLSRRLRPDVLHAVEESVFIAHLVGLRFGIPVVYDMDSSLPEQIMDDYPWLRPLRPALRAAEKLAVRRSAAVLAVSRHLQELAEQYDVGKTIVSRIEDTSLLGSHSQGDEDLRRTIGRDGPLVLYVGNLAPYQGIDLLLESFAHVRKEVPQAQLVVIGGRPVRIQHYREVAEGLAVEEGVHLLGPRPLSMLGTLLRQADVLASPRISGANTPMKIYSYLDSGTAVLATRLPTHTQVLTDEIARLERPAPEPFARGMIELLRDEELRHQLAERARAEVRKEYSPHAFRRKVRDFYAEVEAHLSQNGVGGDGRLPRPEGHPEKPPGRIPRSRSAQQVASGSLGPEDFAPEESPRR